MGSRARLAITRLRRRLATAHPLGCGCRTLAHTARSAKAAALSLSLTVLVKHLEDLQGASGSMQQRLGATAVGPHSAAATATAKLQWLPAPACLQVRALVSCPFLTVLSCCSSFADAGGGIAAGVPLLAGCKPFGSLFHRRRRVQQYSDVKRRGAVHRQGGGLRRTPEPSRTCAQWLEVQ